LRGEDVPREYSGLFVVLLVSSIAEYIYQEQYCR